MTYAEYEFYYNDYYGSKIDGEKFPRLAQKASDYLDYITLNKAKQHVDDEKLKRCCCALAEIYMDIEQAESITTGGEIASESVGSHSVSYRSSADTITGLKAKLLDTAKMYLIGTGWFYRGVSVACTHHIK